MTATVYHHLDDIIISHEIGHAIACIVGGFPLLLVVTDRHQLMDFHGKTEYFMRKEGDPLEIARAHGVVAIAGRYSEPWTTNARRRRGGPSEDLGVDRAARRLDQRRSHGRVHPVPAPRRSCGWSRPSRTGSMSAEARSSVLPPRRSPGNSCLDRREEAARLR